MRPEGWGASIPLSKNPADMFRQAEELNAKLKSTAGSVERMHMKGSLPWLLEKYQHSPRYKALGSRTKELYDSGAEEILKWSKGAGHPHVKAITRPLAFRFLDLFNDTPTKKKNIYSFLRVLMGHACDLGEIEVNPVLKMGVKVPDPVVHIWTDAEAVAMIAAADAMNKPSIGNAICIALEIGQRQGDVLSFEQGKDYKNEKFYFRQRKTKELLVMPAPQMLVKRLAGRADGLLCPAAQGGRYRREQFWKEYDEVRDKAKMPHLKHGHLRHTAIVRLARAGCTHSEIAAISGHTEASVAQILRRYLPRDSVIAENAIKKLERVRLEG